MVFVSKSNITKDSEVLREILYKSCTTLLLGTMLMWMNPRIKVDLSYN